MENYLQRSSTGGGHSTLSARIPLLSVLGIAWFMHQNRSLSFPLLFTALSTAFFTYVGGRSYPYYAFSLCLFLIYGVAAILNCIFASQSKLAVFFGQKTILAGVLALSIELCLLLSPNNYLIGVDKEDLPQYYFKSIIEEFESPTLLNYDFLDGGFYTTSNIYPNCKAFCMLNLPLNELDEIQKVYVDQKLCDFVITRDDELNHDNYYLVAVDSFYFENSYRTYYLYQAR